MQSKTFTASQTLNVPLQENVGIIFEEQGKLEEAEQMYNQTLQIRVKVLGDTSLDVAKTQKNIADIRSAQARYDEAVEMYAGVVQIQQRVLGRNHPLTADTKNNIAVVYKEQAKYPEALQMHQEVLEARLKIFGPDHLHVATTQDNIGNVHVKAIREAALTWSESTTAHFANAGHGSAIGDQCSLAPQGLDIDAASQETADKVKQLFARHVTLNHQNETFNNHSLIKNVRILREESQKEKNQYMVEQCQWYLIFHQDHQ